MLVFWWAYFLCVQSQGNQVWRNSKHCLFLYCVHFAWTFVDWLEGFQMSKTLATHKIISRFPNDIQFKAKCELIFDGDELTRGRISFVETSKNDLKFVIVEPVVALMFSMLVDSIENLEQRIRELESK